MITERENIEYSVVRMDRGDCSDFNCDSRYTHGVEVKITTISKLFGVKVVDKEVEKKVYCPKHQEGSLAKQARRKQHAMAKQEYKNNIQDTNEEKIRRIEREGSIPVYFYRRNAIYRTDNQNSTIEVESFREAVKIFERADNKHTIILYEEDMDRYAIVHKGSMNGSEFRDDDNRKIDTDKLETKYGGHNINRYEYEIIRSNNLSRQKVPKKVRQLKKFDETGFADTDVYDVNSFKIEISECPGCDNRIWSSDLYFAKMEIDGNDRIVAIDNDCDRVIGEINPIFEGSGEYDILR